MTFEDVDLRDFDGGNLTVVYTAGASAEDQLSIRNEGTGSGQIGFSSGNIPFGGTLIGTIPASGTGSGVNGEPLVVSLNTAAPVSAVDALIQNLTYQNTSDVPAASRTISVTVNDGDAGNNTSAAQTTTITVQSVNDTPTLSAIGNPAAILEDANQQTVSLSGITSGAASENQTLSVTATSNNPTLIPNPSVSYTSPNATGTLTYTSVANQNGTATITVTVTDNGGTANSGVNTVSQTFDVTVTAVNDVPTLPAISNPAAILEGANQQTVDLSGIGTGQSDETQIRTGRPSA